MSSSNCCFLTCIRISQEADQVVWYSHLFQNFPQFIVIQTIEGFGVVNKAERDVFLELSCFFDDPEDIVNLISGSSAFSKTSLNIWKFSSNLPKKASAQNTLGCRSRYIPRHTSSAHPCKATRVQAFNPCSVWDHPDWLSWEDLENIAGGGLLWKEHASWPIGPKSKASWHKAID